jgi:WD40 repeat protein
VKPSSIRWDALYVLFIRKISIRIQVVKRNLITKTQEYLRGLHNPVSCLAMTTDAKLVAAGEVTHIGHTADVVLWGTQSNSPSHRLSLHKGSVVSLCFSSSNEVIVSVGGRDDRQVIVWRSDDGVPVCSVQGHTDTIHACRFLSKSKTQFVTCGAQHIKVWTLDDKNKLHADIVGLGSLKRTFTTLSINSSDTTCFCGTQSGDLVEVDLKTRIQRRSGPQKNPFSLGISCTVLIPNGDLIVGTGAGTLAKIAISSLRVLSQTALPDESAVTSISLTPDGTHFFAGTVSGKIYLVNAETLVAELRSTSVVTRVNAFGFPHNMSDVFATASMEGIKVWNTKTKQELLNVQVPKVECLCLDFALDGKSIVSGWSDGKIRSFTPQTGKLLFAIEDAHKEGATAIKMLTDCTRIVSGGMKGEIRIWKLSRSHQELVVSLKEHKGRIWGLVIRTDDNARAVSASADGSCIVWDLEKKSRLICIFESTVFKSVVYSPDFSQIITVATDRRVTYFDVFDGDRLRIIEAQADTVAVSKSGSHIAIAGKDGVVRLIDYDEGIFTHASQEGIHSVGVTALAVAPNQEFIVSGDEQGGIVFWTVPKDLVEKFI